MGILSIIIVGIVCGLMAKSSMTDDILSDDMKLSEENEIYNLLESQYISFFRENMILSDGKNKLHYSNGNKKGEFNVHSNVIEGPFIFYNISGAVISYGTYNNNKLDGKFVKYYKNGIVQKEVYFYGKENCSNGRFFYSNKKVMAVFEFTENNLIKNLVVYDQNTNITYVKVHGNKVVLNKEKARFLDSRASFFLEELNKRMAYIFMKEAYVVKVGFNKTSNEAIEFFSNMKYKFTYEKNPKVKEIEIEGKIYSYDGKVLVKCEFYSDILNGLTVFYDKKGDEMKEFGFSMGILMVKKSIPTEIEDGRWLYSMVEFTTVKEKKLLWDKKRLFSYIVEFYENIIE
ncbi:toxin-antitoxin system YwqK family antitoxin [Fusobacterium sp. PH5-44]|uniref:toxin-antitoxin system YwqK family antitoxin n=1 Tax=unclassified Fusobacterium TaxID=2648384 RepID=UPI003D1E1C52